MVTKRHICVNLLFPWIPWMKVSDMARVSARLNMATRNPGTSPAEDPIEKNLLKLIDFGLAAEYKYLAQIERAASPKR